VTGDLVERLRSALDEHEAHAKKDLWALGRATPGRWEAHYGYNLPYSLIQGDGGMRIARFESRTAGPLPDGADDLHAADTLLVVRLVRKARERAELVLRTIQAHRKIIDHHERTAHFDVTWMCGRSGNVGWPCRTVRLIAAIYLPDIETGDTPT
jgi:hypothetical protein